ncbi:MAG: copper amine oxidase N-terminal domain-containing protein, partial [Oscillospiraceae bacterium]|nr:copper amine oxidase N-terminal domain-containing protein [Oscillospiraceae bacterium]
MQIRFCSRAITALALVCAAFLSLSGAAAAQDSETYAMDTAAFIENGRVYAPARFIAEAFGIAVSWDGGTQTATLARGGTEVRLQIGSRELIRTAAEKRETVQLDVAPLLRGGRTLLPVRPWAEAFGLTVQWDGGTRTATVSEGERALSLVVGQRELRLTGG